MSSTYCEKIPYYKINKILWRWKLYDAENGCYPVPGLAIAMDKSPPLLPNPPSPPSPKAPVPKKDGFDHMLAAAQSLSRFKKWLDTPDPPKPPKSAPQQKKQDAVPPFDLQDIPGAMRKEYMPVSAKLMEKWFAGPLNYSPTMRDEVNGINQDGQPYPPGMIDTTAIKLDWVLKYPRAKASFEFLQTYDRLISPKAIEALGNVLGPLRGYDARVDAWKQCGKDVVKLHKNFEFQLAPVESSFSQKLAQFVSRAESSGGVPDDLTGSLGSFNFYAAVGDATFNRNGNKATITTIIVYVKDNYSFTDDSTGPSQYLGHWSRDGVIIVPATGATGAAGISWPDYPVARGNVRRAGNVHYPVRNSSFRQWQQTHHRGGDFVLYSDCRFVRLPHPIEIVFR